MKIVIIEDEKALLDVLSEKFKGATFDVVSVSTGEGAVEIIRKENPDIVLLDLILPKKSGFEILEELKKDEELRKIPVFVLSNMGEDENLKKAISMGAEDYMVKSQHPIGEVLEKVKKRLLAKAR